jgi:hypothetical protein
MNKKKVLGWCLVAFLLFFITTNAVGAGEVWVWLWHALGKIATGLADFFTYIFRHM